jgi:hypothetical protein
VKAISGAPSDVTATQAGLDMKRIVQATYITNITAIIGHYINTTHCLMHYH